MNHSLPLEKKTKQKFNTFIGFEAVFIRGPKKGAKAAAMGLCRFKVAR